MAVAAPPASRNDRFLALWSRNRGRVRRIVRLFTRAPADAEDLESEVALQLWRSLDAFAGDASEDTWTYRVALNTALCASRGRQFRLRHSAPFADGTGIANPDPDPADRLEATLRRRQLLAALRQLSEIDRALVALHLEELSYREIAEITGLSVNHVGVRLHRARRALARLLGAPGTAGEVVHAP